MTYRKIALSFAFLAFALLTQAQVPSWQVWETGCSSNCGSGSIPAHMDQFVYWGPANGQNSSVTQVRNEATYVENPSGFTGTFDSTTPCDGVTPHPCSSVDWTDQRIIYDQCRHPYNGSSLFNVASAGDPEGWYLHTTTPVAFSNRISANNGGCGGVGLNDYVNPGSTGASSALAQFETGINNTSNVGNINTVDIIGNDDTGCYRNLDGTTAADYASDAAYCTAMQGWLAAEAFGTGPNSTQATIIFNGCNLNPFLLSAVELIKNASTPNVLGCRTESLNGQPDDANGGRYQSLLDVSSVASSRGGMVVIGPECCLGATEAGEISWGTALQWLMYTNPTNAQNKGTAAIQMDLEGGGNLDIYPSSLIYPDPNTALKTMQAASGNCLNESGNFCPTHGHTDLCAAGQSGATSNCNSPTGVFLREFAKCYNNKVLFGACAALIDIGTSNATIQQSWFSQTYTHEITFAAGGGGSFTIDGGGTMNLNGANFTCSAGTCGTITNQTAILLTP